MQTSTAAPSDSTATHGRLGRLGAWAADHHRTIAIVWCGVVLILGALAPVADRALSGAGWEALDSESVAARSALEAQFPGAGSYALSVVVAGPRAGIDDPAARATLARVVAVLRSDDAVSGVPVPQVSRDRSSAVVLGLAGARPDEMVEAAGRLKGRLARLSSPGVAVRLTGAAGRAASPRPRSCASGSRGIPPRSCASPRSPSTAATQGARAISSPVTCARCRPASVWAGRPASSSRSGSTSPSETPAPPRPASTSCRSSPRRPAPRRCARRCASRAGCSRPEEAARELGRARAALDGLPASAALERAASLLA